MSDPFLAHILTQTKQNIDFLAAQNIISHADRDTLMTKLPSASDASVLTLSRQTQGLVVSNRSPAARPPPPRRNVPPPGTVRARALWGFNERDEDVNDLTFHPGDIIEIISETNEDWWTGRLNGRQGLFPSNYVEKIDSGPSSQAPPPSLSAPRFPGGPSPSPSPSVGYQASYGPPPVGYQSPPYEKGVPYNPYMGPPMQPNAPAPVMQVQQQPAPPPPKPSRFAGLGSTMATSAAGGLGFGAGAAIGGDLINSIF